MITRSILHKKQEIVLNILNSRLNYAIPMDRLSFRSKVCLSIALTIMFSFFVVQSAIVFKFIKASYYTSLFGYFCIIAFTPPFFSFVKEFLDNITSNEKDLLFPTLDV